MTELSLSHSYTFRWQDPRALPAKRQAHASRRWLLLFGIETGLLLALLIASIFIVNDRVRLETASRSLYLTLTQTQEKVSDLSLELARLRSPQELEEIARSQGLLTPPSPRYLSL